MAVDKEREKSNNSKQNNNVDIVSMREKYRQERDKRIRTDGLDQYNLTNGEFSSYVKDPFVAPGFSRQALTDEVEVAVIGAGFGGLIAAAKLREAGVKDIRLIDQAGDVGGTWYWNRFPGAKCDTESYIYLPLLEELNYTPTEKYISGAEVWEYCRSIATKYDLYDNACFQTEVTELRWDEEINRWVVSTDRGDRMLARYVCMSNGILHRPKLPGVPGVSSFKGHSFHTCRWDYDYTGGDLTEPLVGLEGKRVAIIGTGATGIQCIPRVAESAGHLYVFQRTPSTVEERNNYPTDVEWMNKQKPGWHQQRLDNFNILTSGGQQQEDLVNDGWTDGNRRLTKLMQAEGANTDLQTIVQWMETIDFQKMDEIRARVDSIVTDKTTAEALKPYYRYWCKRPCFHDDYLKCFNQDSVTLVDTKGKGVERISDHALHVDGVAYEVDCLIFATGFDFLPEFSRKTGYDVIGKGGVELTDKWDAGMATLFGIQTPGFPNCFVLSNSQSAFSVNFPHTLAEQSLHIAHVIGHAVAEQYSVINVSDKAAAEWAKKIIEQPTDKQQFLNECTPGYINKESEKGEVNRQSRAFGDPVEYFKILRSWRAEGSLKGVELE